MKFWCSNDGTNWTWDWQPYLGAWAIMLVVVAALWRAGAWRSEVPLRRRVCLAVGLLLLLGGLDWPLAKLGAGYLVSAQMVRQVAIVTVATPLILYGSPVALGRWILATERRRSVLAVATRPLVALVGAVVLLVSASTPIVVDALVTNQVGSFVLDLAWIAAGFLIWMPVQPPSPITPRISGPATIVYLIGVSVAPLPVAFFMTWSDFPIYDSYQLAPRVWNSFGAKDDQEFAAAIFQVAGGLIIWMQITVRFVRMAGGSSGPRFRGTLVADPAETR